jgi:hypothetical protein
MLANYWDFLAIARPHVTAAETELTAGLMRLHTLRETRGRAAFLAGTSLSAKLPADVLFRGFDGAIVNMGVDGAPPIFAAREILAADAQPSIVMIEANYILLPFDGNTALLDDVSQTPMFWLGSRWDLFRRDYRPVTLVYSHLKSLRDRALSGDGTIAATVALEQPAATTLPDEQRAWALTWADTIRRLQARGAQIVLTMLPDGEQDRTAEYQMMRYLAGEFRIPVLDLKARLAGQPLVYSDGVHLIASSARAVATAVNRPIVRGLMERPSVASHEGTPQE